MIKVQVVDCPWCHRKVHGVIVGNEVRCECSVCHDSFAMPMDAQRCYGGTEE